MPSNLLGYFGLREVMILRPAPPSTRLKRVHQTAFEGRTQKRDRLRNTSIASIFAAPGRTKYSIKGTPPRTRAVVMYNVLLILVIHGFALVAFALSKVFNSQSHCQLRCKQIYVYSACIAIEDFHGDAGGWRSAPASRRHIRGI